MTQAARDRRRSWIAIAVGLVVFVAAFAIGKQVHETRGHGDRQAIADGGFEPISKPSPEKRERKRPGIPEITSATVPSEVFNLAAHYLRDASAAEVAELAEAWNYAIDQHSSPEMCWKMLLAKWVEFDPEAAWAAAGKIEYPPAQLTAMRRGNNKYNQMHHAVLRSWVQADWQGALAVAEQDPKNLLWPVFDVVLDHDIERAFALSADHPDMPWLTTKVFTRLAKSDPKRAFEQSSRIPEEHSKRQMRDAVLREWAAIDPAGAIQQVEQLKEPAFEIRRVRNALIAQILKHDIQAAEQHILSLDKSERWEPFARLAEHKAKADPTAAMVWARNLPPGSERQSALAAAVKEATKGVPGKVIELFDEIGWENVRGSTSGYRSRLKWGRGSEVFSGSGSLLETTTKAITELAKTDPQRALGYDAKLPASAYASGSIARNSALMAISSEWFEADPEAFFDWLPSSPSSVQSELAEGLVRGATPEERDWIAEHGLGGMDGELREALSLALVDWIGTDESPDRALSLADKVEGNAHEVALKMATLLTANIDRDFPRALELLDTLPLGSEREGTIAGLIRGVAREDFAAAQEWFGTLPAADRTPAAFASMTNAWFKEDSLEASEWVGSLPPGPEREGATKALVDRITWSNEPDFSAAVKWAESIASESEQKQSLTTVYHRWLRKDYSTAEKALRASSVPESLKKEILYDVN